jgi:hypothetical protein
MRKAFALAILACMVLTVAAVCQQSGKPLDRATYNTVIVQKFDIQTLAEKENFPAGYGAILQKTAVVKLQKHFEKVIDASETPAPAPGAAPPEMKGKVLLSGAIIGYDKGSRTARWMVGMGAGSSKVKVRFIFRDAESGAELWRTDQQGSFAGTFTMGGGSEDKAVSESSRKVVEALVKELGTVR